MGDTSHTTALSHTLPGTVSIMNIQNDNIYLWSIVLVNDMELGAGVEYWVTLELQERHLRACGLNGRRLEVLSPVVKPIVWNPFCGNVPGDRDLDGSLS